MDVFTEISAVQSRIAEITGAPPIAVQPTPAQSFSSVLSRTLDPQTVGAQPFNTTAGLAPAPVPPEQIESLVNQNAAIWQVDPALVKAVIANESSFNANATSPVGAQGLMQLMPDTAAQMGVKDAYDPAQNVAGGTRYLKAMLDRFNGDQRLAVAAYNAGPEAVAKYNGVPPYAETQQYVTNVLGSYNAYRSATP